MAAGVSSLTPPLAGHLQPLPSPQASGPHHPCTLLSQLQECDACRSQHPFPGWPTPPLTLHTLLSYPGSCPGPRASCRRTWEARQSSLAQTVLSSEAAMGLTQEGQGIAGLESGPKAGCLPGTGLSPSQPVGILGKGSGDHPSPHLLQSIWLLLGAEK